MNSRNDVSTHRPRRWRWTAPLLLLLPVSHAHADWRVTDGKTQAHLRQIEDLLNKQTNQRIEEIRDQQTIGRPLGASGKPDDPGVILEKDNPTTVRLTSSMETLRCSDEPAATKKVLHDRWTVCSEIVKTELAQYNYALAMRAVAIQRQDRLKAIEDARSSLNQGYQDVGKLQSNSNELLALLARMEVDKQQYRTYMDAYASRLTYLQALRESLGQQAINGKGALAQLTAGVASVAALKAALDQQKTRKKCESSKCRRVFNLP